MIWWKLSAISTPWNHLGGTGLTRVWDSLGIDYIHKFAHKSYENLPTRSILDGQSFVDLQLLIYLLKLLFFFLSYLFRTPSVY